MQVSGRPSVVQQPVPPSPPPPGLLYDTPSSARDSYFQRPLPPEPLQFSRHSSPAPPVLTAGPGSGSGPGLTSSASIGSIPLSATLGHLGVPGPSKRGYGSSATWTSSSGDLGGSSDTDDVQERVYFVDQYNRLAKKHGIRVLVPADWDPLPIDQYPQEKRNWFSRTFLRQISGASNASSTGSRSHEQSHGHGHGSGKVHHRRSFSDLALHIVHPVSKKDALKDEDLQSLVRLCGKSKLYLPAEYTPCSLVLPTCLRATAQYLVQHAVQTRGVFRVSGSAKAVSALYDYYCGEPSHQDAASVASTTRCPNLPLHVRADVHDVASVFKRFLANLPGGILGSLALFDALVAIHSQLHGNAELTHTKQSKVRARLIALAIGSLQSQFRRELICAVFGLLSLVGRAAEKAPREDARGRPLPTGDLMGYAALGIVFGPLLVGDRIDAYTMKLANPNAGLVLLPMTPPKVRKERRRSKGTHAFAGLDDRQQGQTPAQAQMQAVAHAAAMTVDKIHVANSIAEMLITHWREVVKHMKNLGVPRVHSTGTAKGTSTGSGIANRIRGFLRPSISESFASANRQPDEWMSGSGPDPIPPSRSVTFKTGTGESPMPPSPTPASRSRSRGSQNGLSVKRKRPKGARPISTNRLPGGHSMPLLSPTAEESPLDVSSSRSDDPQSAGRAHAATLSAPRSGGAKRLSDIAAARQQLKSTSQPELQGREPMNVRRMNMRSFSQSMKGEPPAAQQSVTVPFGSVHYAAAMVEPGYIRENPSVSRVERAEESPSRQKSMTAAVVSPETNSDRRPQRDFKEILGDDSVEDLAEPCESFPSSQIRTSAPKTGPGQDVKRVSSASPAPLFAKSPQAWGKTETEETAVSDPSGSSLQQLLRYSASQATPRRSLPTASAEGKPEEPLRQDASAHKSQSEFVPRHQSTITHQRSLSPAEPKTLTPQNSLVKRISGASSGSKGSSLRGRQSGAKDSSSRTGETPERQDSLRSRSSSTRKGAHKDEHIRWVGRPSLERSDPPTTETSGSSGSLGIENQNLQEDRQEEKTDSELSAIAKSKTPEQDVRAGSLDTGDRETEVGVFPAVPAQASLPQEGSETPKRPDAPVTQSSFETDVSPLGGTSSIQVQPFPSLSGSAQPDASTKKSAQYQHGTHFKSKPSRSPEGSVPDIGAALIISSQELVNSREDPFKDTVPTTARKSRAQERSSKTLGKRRTATSPSPHFSTPTSVSTRVSLTHPEGLRSAGNAVKAMAAKWETASKDSAFVPTPMQKVKSWSETRSGNIVSQYTTNASPNKTPTRVTRGSRTMRSDSVKSVKTDQSPAATPSLPSQPPSRAAVITEDSESSTPRQQTPKKMVHEKERNSPATTRIPDSATEDGTLTPRRQTQRKATRSTASNVTARRDFLVPASSTALAGPNLGSTNSTPRSWTREPIQRERSPLRSEKYAPITMKDKPWTQNDKSTSRPTILSHDHPGGDSDSAMAPSLGRMTPHQEEPDVARHINFSRPPSATSQDHHGDEHHHHRDSPSAGNNTQLHQQIRVLKKALDTRTDEVVQLRRQLEARTAGAEDSAGTLSEQLRATKRECRMWRERAEAAERRVAVFERFTARIRRLRENSKGAAAAAQLSSTDEEDEGAGRRSTPLPVTARMMKVQEEEGDEDDPVGELVDERGGHHSALHKRGSRRSRDGDSVGQHMEDERVLTDRIRSSFQAMDGVADYSRGWEADEEGDDSKNDIFRTPSAESKTSSGTVVVVESVNGERLSASAAGMWMAAQELIENEDMRNWLVG